MLSDPTLVVAQLRLPASVDGITTAMRGLSKMYRDRELVIVTDGPLWRDGWMVIAHKTSRGGADD